MRKKRSSSKIPYLLFSTVGSPGEAKKIARYLVQKRLAACVNIVPQLVSFFRWKGKVDRARELLLVIKSNRGRLKQIEKAIHKLHSYSVPEIIAVPIKWGHKPYLDWLFGSISD